jgi:hypothetical protein
MCSAGWEKDSKQQLTFAHRMLMEGDPQVHPLVNIAVTQLSDYSAPS